MPRNPSPLLHYADLTGRVCAVVAAGAICYLAAEILRALFACLIGGAL